MSRIWEKVKSFEFRSEKTRVNDSIGKKKTWTASEEKKDKPLGFEILVFLIRGFFFFSWQIHGICIQNGPAH